MKKTTLAQKIGLGYALQVALLVASALITLSQVSVLEETAQRLESQHIPTAEAGLQMRAGVYAAESALRGWLVTRNDNLAVAFQRAWSDEIDPSLHAFELLSPHWTNPDNRARLQQLKPHLEEFRRIQTKVREAARTDATAAQQVLEEQALPKAAELHGILQQMVENQQQLKTGEIENFSRRVVLLTNLVWSLLAGGVTIGIVLSVLTARSIAKPVGEAVAVADRIADGDFGTPVKVSGSREIDTLGRSLVNMRDSLRANTEAMDRAAWLAAGQNRLDQVMRGDKSVDDLADDVTVFIANYVGAHAGALYLAEESGQGLVLTGRFAFSGSESAGRFALGEGLVGQTAVENRSILVNELDGKDIRVISSLIDTPPRAVYVSPFCFDGTVLGVLELGKLDALGDDEIRFVNECMSAVGIAINSALARQRIQQLLEETRQQSEELQQQQEELEQTNEELEEQTQNLREQQDELQAANEELEEQTQLIAEKNQSLEAARDSIELKARQLEVSSKYKSEFLANMSHELRTPLNSLLILANELAANGPGNLTDEQVESAQVISKSGNDLLGLINDILDLSKVEAGKLDVKVSTISVARFVDDIRRNFRHQARAKGLDFELVVDETAPDTIQSDRQRLGQIINNLVSNAVKFTEAGGVTVTVKLEAGGYLVIEVRDTGIGIPADKLDAVFEAFVQADGGTSRKYGGTGLGLSISRELAKLLGGYLTVASEPGQGATFTLFIPPALERPKDTQGPNKPNPPAPAERKRAGGPQSSRYQDYPTIDDQRNHIQPGDRTLLIIEDDDDFATVLATQAAEKGFRHINAATGEDGLKLAAGYQPDAIILDVTLPGMDGHAVLTELKGNPALRHIPVHIISANERSVDPIKAGAVDYLTKPVTREQLDAAFDRIESFVERKVKNLLIVEDDENLRQAIVRLIGNGDVTCLEASTGGEALKVITTNTVDCVVLDVGLPDMSGFELIRALDRGDNTMPPIIVYTGRELTREENDELRQYAETIIVKGVKSEERLLDETALFLHRTVKNLPESKREIINRMYDPEEALHGKCILVVDDDMRNVFALSKVLKSRGMEVMKAENGKAALALLEVQSAVDMVLMDIMMPEMDGYECMQEIRKRNGFRDLPVIALTAKAMKEDRQKCIDAGANDYISKPVDIDRLISLMRIWMRQ